MCILCHQGPQVVPGQAADGGVEAKASTEDVGAAAGFSQPRKTLLVHVDPEVALRRLADTLGERGDIWEGVDRNAAGEITKIKWSSKDLNGTLPTFDLGMPFLTHLNLFWNPGLKGVYCVTVWGHAEKEGCQSRRGGQRVRPAARQHGACKLLRFLTHRGLWCC